MTPEPVILGVDGLQALIDLLRQQGYQVIGPTVRDGAVCYAEVTSTAELPAGHVDVQAPGSYRLDRDGNGAFFGFAAAANSWKSFLHPARTLLSRQREGAPPEGPAPDADRMALLGVRSCDLHAIGVLDRVLRDRTYADPGYTDRRAGLFIVAVACARPGGTCFCTSMGTGPAPTEGYDLSLTELVTDTRHAFVAVAGTRRGQATLSALSGLTPITAASPADCEAAGAVTEAATAAIERHLDVTDIRDLLYANAGNARWEEVAQRCLSCGNCTLVCPTCFCTSTDDVTDLTTGATERWRVWDSCFSLGYSHLSGGSIRTSVSSRYRQWMTHKLAAWIDQFGTSGCVGCGRCITWCPVGIDITEEAAAIRASAGAEPQEGVDDADDQ